jgi:hypothetical protein
MQGTRPGAVDFEERNLLSVIELLEARMRSMADRGGTNRERRRAECRAELRAARERLEALRRDPDRPAHDGPPPRLDETIAT